MTPEEQAALDAANAPKTPAVWNRLGFVAETIIHTRTATAKTGKKAGKLQYVNITKSGKEIWTEEAPTDNAVVYSQDTSDQTGARVFNNFQGYTHTIDVVGKAELLTEMSKLGMTNAISLD